MGFGSSKDQYDCLDRDGIIKARIKVKYEAHERGKLFEIGNIESFSVSFNHSDSGRKNSTQLGTLPAPNPT